VFRLEAGVGIKRRSISWSTSDKIRPEGDSLRWCAGIRSDGTPFDCPLDFFILDIAPWRISWLADLVKVVVLSFLAGRDM
jgi:hypothetical protein